MSHFAALLDACVLHHADLRDFLIWLAPTRLFRAKWTTTIHKEWIRSIVRRRHDLEQEEIRTRLLRTASFMNSTIPDSLVTGYESLIAGINLQDPDDRHVVAAAVFSRCAAPYGPFGYRFLTRFLSLDRTLVRLSQIG